MQQDKQYKMVTHLGFATKYYKGLYYMYMLEIKILINEYIHVINYLLQQWTKCFAVSVDRNVTHVFHRPGRMWLSNHDRGSEQIQLNLKNIINNIMSDKLLHKFGTKI